MSASRRWFRIDCAWIKRREATLITQEDAAIRLARDEAPTPELRAFADHVIERRRKARETQDR